jgi:hypothetical protein
MIAVENLMQTKRCYIYRIQAFVPIYAEHSDNIYKPMTIAEVFVWVWKLHQHFDWYMYMAKKP